MRVLLLLSGVLLAGCQAKKPIYRYYYPNVQNVRFLTAVKQGEALNITLEVWTGGGCDSFDRIEAKRTTSELNLEPIGRTPDDQANAAQGVQVACVTTPNAWQTVSYEDAGTSPRSNPFGIRVNGKLFGEVKVQ